jgi:predicted RecB family nuclease
LLIGPNTRTVGNELQVRVCHSRMKITAERIRLSATDLANHVACRHLTALEVQVARGILSLPKTMPGLPASLRHRGEAHERAYVDYLGAQGHNLVDLQEFRFDAEGFRATREAMAIGAEVLLQAPLGSDHWVGRADVLQRVERPSALGGWSYEPLDTKLTRETRGAAILQLCAYADMLTDLQGLRPEYMHVVVPGQPFSCRAYRVDDFFAYYSFVRGRLMAAVNKPEADTYPDPTAHCEVCRWMIECAHRRRKDDHLSLVANIRKLQIAEFEDWNIRSLAALGTTPLPFLQRPTRTSVESLTKTQQQARVQHEARLQGTLVFERLPLTSHEGLFRLPAPSVGDIFFDIEGDPFVGQSGREYLFGYAYRNADGNWVYRAVWALDANAEKQAFQHFVAFVMERWKQHRDLHVYHYAAYEPSALRRLMGKHGVCEDDVDQMLRGGVFIDLYAVSRQAVRASVERYSIKNLEPFYGFTRSIPLIEAGAQLRAVEFQLELGDTTALADDTRVAAEQYNRDDCLSAVGLRDWLESIRACWEAEGYPVERPSLASPDAKEELREREEVVRAVMNRLLEGVPVDIEQQTPEQRALWILAQLLEFHRREDKSVWWEFFRLAELPAEDALDEPAALGGVEFQARVGGTKKCPIDRYRFPPQELTIRSRSEVYASQEVKLGAIHQFDLDARTIDIKKTSATAEQHPPTVFFHQRINPRPLPDSLLRLAMWVADHGLTSEGPYRALRNLLRNAPPTLTAGTPWRIDGEGLIDRARRLATSLRDTVLPIQGPPGTGKTYAGAHMACALVRAGRRVGVTGTSHKVIRHLIETIIEVAKEETLPIKCIQKIGEDDDSNGEDIGIATSTSNADVLDALKTGAATIAGGTVWMWARPEFREAVDVLIVDEAGQISLANVLAGGQAAHSLVLLGDPQQLEQPLKGSHPTGTDVSVLQHVLGSNQTIPDDRGLFLAHTWRLSPNICSFASELFYERRLKPKAGLENQRIDGPEEPTGSGLWFVPVEHVGNQNSSPEEATVVSELSSRLASGSYTWSDEHGDQHVLDYGDILIVAPYNAQVHAIQELLPDARVGTVDRFQGQEAPVVIYSMATSTPEDAPRGMEFLYSLNRLNVAISRAKCAAILVANPRLFEPDCQTPRHMQLANAFCRYLELARPVNVAVEVV